jgi:branched-subunit amino acid ABC-type transport system permease component
VSNYLGYLLAGLGGGAVVASLALGLVLTHRSSGVVNFAHGAMGVYIAFAFYEFRRTGDVVLPILGLPARVHVLARPTVAAALAMAVVLAALVGVLTYWLVFRPLRQAPALAKVVASLGLLLYLQELVRLRFPVAGAAVQVNTRVLPEDPVEILGTTVTANRLILAGLVVLVTVVLGGAFRYTRFGLSTRAAAGNEKGALLVGISPDRLGAANWALATILAGVAVILIEPIAGLHPTTTPLLIVPALAAALLGGLESFALTTAGGLAIGMVQSLVLGYAVQPSTTWIPEWLPTTGLQQLVPVAVIVGVLMWRGDALPDRAAVAGRRLPPSPEPRHLLAWTAVLAGAATLGLLTFDASHRQALMVSMVAALLALSVVVVTGYSGQISLAQLAIAGVAGFLSIRLVEDGWPFLVAVVAATLVAVLLGVLIGLPATRVRGMTLAVATLAMAIAVEELVLASSALSGGAAGVAVPRPDLFGWDIGVSAPGTENYRAQWGFVVLAVLVGACLVVANLRRNPTGLRWLAVRANERAAAVAGIDVTRAKLGAFAVSSGLAGLAGVLLVFSATSVSRTSFMVIGALVALALTYLGGVSAIAGALVAGALASSGIVTTLLDGGSEGKAATYSYAVSGLALIVVAILAPEGITGVVRRQVARVRGLVAERT